jgi:hypothetical protein
MGYFHAFVGCPGEFLEISNMTVLGEMAMPKLDTARKSPTALTFFRIWWKAASSMSLFPESIPVFSNGRIGKI